MDKVEHQRVYDVVRRGIQGYMEDSRSKLDAAKLFKIQAEEAWLATEESHRRLASSQRLYHFTTAALERKIRYEQGEIVMAREALERHARQTPPRDYTGHSE